MAIPLRVLVVEDSEPDTRLLLRELTKGGFEPEYTRVETAEAMRAALARQPWDVVLADYRLPHFSGEAALQVLQESGLDLPFIVVSGTIGEEKAVAMMKAGAHDYILKGNLARLVPAMARELREAEERRERRRAETALEESEEQLRLITENSPDAIIMIDEESIIRFANPAAETIFGYPIDEIIGQPLTMLMPERFRERHLTAVQHYLITGHRHLPSWQNIEVFGLHHSGREIPLELSYGEFRRGDKRFFIGVVRDITERQVAEQALRESEERYRTMVETAYEGVWMLDAEAKTAFVNTRMAEMLGYTMAEMLGQPLFAFTDETGRTEAAQYWHERQQGIKAQHEFRFVRKDGSDLWTIVSTNPLFDAQGQFAGALGMVTDITDRKRSEEALARERAFLASAIDLLPFPILLIAPTREVIRQNKASIDLLHTPDSHLWWRIQLQDPQTHVPIPPQEWPLLRALRGETMPTTELQMALPDGRELPILLQGAPIYVGDEFIAAVIAFQDITALKEADRAKNQFLALLSHELRTPLTNILGWARQAREMPDITDQALQVIMRNAESQARMLENLLEVSRLIHGKLTLNTEPTDLWQVTTQTVEAMRWRAEERRLTITLQPPDRPLPIIADVKRLQKVIGNLVDNALKFTGPGGAITIAGRREDGRAVLAVHDTGQGLDPAQVPTLFTLFQFPPGAEVTGGLHLGLPLVKQLVEMHGGHVAADSPVVGQGSTFTVSLPLAEETRCPVTTAGT